MVKRNIQTQIQIDLAVVTLMYVILYSSMFIACEIFGPSSSIAKVKTAFWMIQCLFNIGFNCIITLEFIQIYNIFSLTILDDYSKSRHLLISQIFVFVFGIIVGSVLCSAETGSCRKTAIYNHFIIDTLRSTDDHYSYLSGVSWISYGSVICMCQLSIEYKRYVLNKADQKAYDLALNAAAKLQDAASKLKTPTPVELGIHNLLSEHELHPRTFQHVKTSIFTPSQNKVAPQSKIPLDISDCETHQALEQEPSALTEDYKNYIRPFPVQNNYTGIIKVEEIPINAVNQPSHSVFNVTQPQYENDRLKVSTQYLFNERLDSVNRQQMTQSIQSISKSSRERVNIQLQ